MAWQAMAWHGMVWRGMAWYGVVWYGMAMQNGSMVLGWYGSTLKGSAGSRCPASRTGRIPAGVVLLVGVNSTDMLISAC